MTLPSTDDPRISLIEAAIRFANGAHPDVAFASAIEAARERLRERHLEAFADAAGRKFRTAATVDKPVKARLQLREQLAIVSLVNLNVRGDRQTRAAVGKLVATQVRWLGRIGPRALVLTGVQDVGGRFAEFSVPLWTDSYVCAWDAMALILSDYRGSFGRVSICPYGAPARLRLDPRNIGGSLRPLVADRDVHFFADLRFAKGTAMKYCSLRHQRTDYMRKYRQRKPT